MATMNRAATRSNPAARSCASCPSNLNPTQQGQAVGRSIGGPMCGLKLIPLSRPGVGNDKKMFEHFATGCDQYGQRVDFNANAKNAAIELKQVAFPDPKAETSDDWMKEPVSSCTGCANFVPPRLTKKLIGWDAGYCRAKGQLLIEDRLQKYAQGCESRKFQPKEKRLSDFDSRPIEIILMPEYGPDFGKPKRVDIFAVHNLNMRIKPSDYPTDKEVGEPYRRVGVKAFRKIEDPKGYGPPLWLPIMDENHMIEVDGQRVPMFTESDRAAIPRSGDRESPEKYFDHNAAVYRIIAFWLKLKQTPAVWGIAGTGKTELFRHIAWMMSMPFTRVSITETSEYDDLFGKTEYTPEKGTFFSFGRIPTAIQRPGVICLDEPNTGPPAVWQAIRPMTDDSKQLVVNDVRIKFHPLAHLGFAMNPAWDPRNTGVAELADADGSRLMHMRMDLPPENIERQILTEALLEDRWSREEIEPRLNTMMTIAKDLRRMSDDGGIPITWGIRNQKKVIRATRYLSWTDAFRAGVIDSLEPEVGDQILEIVKGYDDSDELF